MTETLLGSVEVPGLVFYFVRELVDRVSSVSLSVLVSCSSKMPPFRSALLSCTKILLLIFFAPPLFSQSMKTLDAAFM